MVAFLWHLLPNHSDCAPDTEYTKALRIESEGFRAGKENRTAATVRCATMHSRPAATTPTVGVMHTVVRCACAWPSGKGTHPMCALGGVFAERAWGILCGLVNGRAKCVRMLIRRRTHGVVRSVA